MQQPTVFHFAFILEIRNKSKCKKPSFIIYTCNYLIAVNSTYFLWAVSFILFPPTSNNKKPYLKPLMFKIRTDFIQLNH